MYKVRKVEESLQITFMISILLYHKYIGIVSYSFIIGCDSSKSCVEKYDSGLSVLYVTCNTLSSKREFSNRPGRISVV